MRSNAVTLLAAVAVLLAASIAVRAADYHVVKQTVLGGEGGWDYVTVDPDAHRIYVPRGTHVMVLDEVTHKVVGDIKGLRGLHGVAIAPKANRGFVTGNDPKGVVYVFDLKTNEVTTKIPRVRRLRRPVLRSGHRSRLRPERRFDDVHRHRPRRGEGGRHD